MTANQIPETAHSPVMAPESGIIAVLPAAGKATRLGSIPCSKEILPLAPLRPGSFNPAPGSRVVIEDALHMLGECGVDSALIVTAPEKTDICAYLGAGPVGGVELGFLVCEDSPSVPHTLRSAVSEAGNRDMLLWFPDIVAEPRTLIRTLIADHRKSAADISLALVPSDRGEKVDIVSVDSSGSVLDIRPKPGKGISGWTWVAGLWSATFSAFLDRFVQSSGEAGREIYVGDVINAARRSHFIVQSVNFSSGRALDIGTPEDLARLWTDASRT